MPYSELKDGLRDVAFTTATPFTADGTAVDEAALAENVQALADAGAELFVPCGNTGEYYALSDRERVAVVRTHVEQVPEEAVVVGGVGGSTKTAAALIDAYRDAGADAAMVMYPGHTYVHEQGLVEYYRALADATDLGLVVYKRGPELTHSVLRELAAIENVVGVKYAVNDIYGFKRAVADIDADVVWLNGIAERFALSFAVEGAEGYTTGIGNFAPEVTLSLFDAVSEGDWERARRLQERIRPYEDLRDESGAGNSIGSANNVPAVKYGLDLAGLNGGPVREPLVDLADDDRRRAEDYYEQLLEATDGA